MPPPFNDDLLFPSRFYNNASFPVQSGKVIQLARVEQDMIKNPSSGQLQPKLLLWFVGCEKAIICSRPNYDAFVTTWGRDGSQWIDKNVVVSREAMASAPGGQRVRFTPVNEPVATSASTQTDGIPF
jgi:hypothetical protein